MLIIQKLLLNRFINLLKFYKTLKTWTSNIHTICSVVIYYFLKYLGINLISKAKSKITRADSSAFKRKQQCLCFVEVRIQFKENDSLCQELWAGGTNFSRVTLKSSFSLVKRTTSVSYDPF